jgi:diacylglycerol kinase (ATP)
MQLLTKTAIIAIMQSEFKSKSGLKRIFNAWSYSVAGLRAAWTYEHAFRQELVLFFVATVVAFICPVARLERLALICAIALVLIVEVLNSALEAVVDLVSPQFHELAKRAKDMGSAAVFLALWLCTGVWAVILIPIGFR